MPEQTEFAIFELKTVSSFHKTTLKTARNKLTRGKKKDVQ